MRYMFLIYSQERSEPLPQQEAETLMGNHWALMQETKEKGILLGVDAASRIDQAPALDVDVHSS